MEGLLNTSIAAAPLPLLLLVIAGLILVLGKGADLLVEEAVGLSLKWNISRVLVGATVVSLGTTFPEAAVSVWAAVRGNPEIALGNAVGSVICDTGLILGLITLISPLPLKKEIVNRQGWLQFSAGCLLVVSCIPFLSGGLIWVEGGMLPQFMGLVFLLLLALYLWGSIRWMKDEKQAADENHKPPRPTWLLLLRIAWGALLVMAASHFLIPAVQLTALKLHVPEGIVSATLIAFGTSLPELVTALTAVSKGHGELALGNIIGADILNVLFVAGAAASVSKPGLAAPVHFFTLLFPAMLIILLVFRMGIHFSDTRLKHPYGVALLGVYGITTVFSYLGIGA